MRVAPGLRVLPEPAAPWSVAALVLAGLGVAASTWVIIGSNGDPGHVLWPLVAAPVAICALPVVLPHRGVRIGSALVQGAWCFLTGFTIGVFLLPALFALVAALQREER